MVGNGLRRFVCVDHVKRVAWIWNTGQTKDLNRRRRTGFFERSARMVVNGSDFTRKFTGHHEVAVAQRTRLHQDRGHGATPFVQLRFNDGAHSFFSALAFSSMTSAKVTKPSSNSSSPCLSAETANV